MNTTVLYIATMDDIEDACCDGVSAPGRNVYIDQIGFFGDAVAINGEWARALIFAPELQFGFR